MTTTATRAVANGNAPARDTFEKRMPIDVSVVRDLGALRALEAEWRALAGSGPGALFRGPDWLIPWWLAYHNTLGAELHVLVGRATEGPETGHIVCLAPLYRRTVKVALIDTRELRMMGDAGPRPPALDLLARTGWEDRAGAAFAKALIDEADSWDVVDLEPLADPSRIRANLVQRLAPAGFTIESAPSAGGATRIALAFAPAESTDASGVVTTFGDDLGALRKGMSALRRLSRLEWAERDEPSPIATSLTRPGIESSRPVPEGLTPLADREVEALLRSATTKVDADVARAAAESPPPGQAPPPAASAPARTG